MPYQYIDEVWRAVPRMVQAVRRARQNPARVNATIYELYCRRHVRAYRITSDINAPTFYSMETIQGRVVSSHNPADLIPAYIAYD